MHERIGKAMAALARRGRLRTLSPACGHDFTSNDYLALTTDPRMKMALVEALESGIPVGAGGSRLLRGNHETHEALEARASTFFGTESSLFFAGGYLANLALWSTLPGRNDFVVYDERSHASTLDGIRAGAADHSSARHCDPAAFDGAIKMWRASGGRGSPWLAVESLFSMDGDIAPLADLLAVAEKHDGVLVVDEAHATGAFGKGGRGLAADLEGKSNVITVHTCGKALGAFGAIICGPRDAIAFLVNRARSFIYATAPSPLMAIAVDRALTIVDEDADRRARLHRLIEGANAQLWTTCSLPGSGTQIIPVVLGQDRLATEAAAELQAAGYDVRAIRPPTVPEGTSRLRIAITLHADELIISGLFACLAEILARRS